MEKQKQKKPKKSPELLVKLSSALRKNLQRRKNINRSIPQNNLAEDNPVKIFSIKDVN